MAPKPGLLPIGLLFAFWAGPRTNLLLFAAAAGPRPLFPTLLAEEETTLLFLLAAAEAFYLGAAATLFWAGAGD